ncbi:MAG: HAD-IA family hydrolase [Deltaproteobacteria bacterium]|nr:HAD-IA family hydrolase [Deltaproteobacteria bacterium]
MQIKAVLFDRDGVLLDYDEAAAMNFFTGLFEVSTQELFEHWEKWGRKVGFPKTLHEEKFFFEGFWQELSQVYQLDAAAQKKLHDLDYLKFLQPFPEVIPTLQKIKACGLEMGVLSNFSLASLEASLEKTGLLDFFKAACAATVIGASKPEAKAYEIALDQLGYSAKEVLFVDDKADNVLGAEKIGMQSLLLDRSLPAHQYEHQSIADLSGVLYFL